MKQKISRQSFLGADSPEILNASTVGAVGLGGGGSHIIQQFSHVGIGTVVCADPDYTEDTNENRLIGIDTDYDLKNQTPKIDIATRMAKKIKPDIKVIAFKTHWQSEEASLALRGCDIIIGCVDSFTDRDQLERFCRRFHIIYIDIGMDVYEEAGEYYIHGQITQSVPGGHCLRCLGIIQEHRLAEEARKYGAAGVRPQVVWPNGVLASTAIGLAVQALTPWHSKPLVSACWEYDGNTGTVILSPKVEIIRDLECRHFFENDIGDPFWDQNRA